MKLQTIFSSKCRRWDQFRRMNSLIKMWSNCRTFSNVKTFTLALFLFHLKLHPYLRKDGSIICIHSSFSRYWSSKLCNYLWCYNLIIYDTNNDIIPILFYHSIATESNESWSTVLGALNEVDSFEVEGSVTILDQEKFIGKIYREAMEDAEKI